MVQKNFLIIGHRAHTAVDWKLDDICGGAGRLDVLVRSVTAALWKSHGIRHDTDVWLSLRGKPEPDITVHFSGIKIKYLNPDERSTAALIRNGLIKLKGKNGPLETSPGVTMQRENFSELVKKLPKPVLLNENGENKIKPEYQTFILGDDRDPTEEEMKILNSLDKAKIGETSLLTSACITLIHHFLDE
tara:strand:+ start:10 stop:576 length:567 start_codon:yes stop_codon:yes gene_type:complete